MSSPKPRHSSSSHPRLRRLQMAGHQRGPPLPPPSRRLSSARASSSRSRQPCACSRLPRSSLAAVSRCHLRRPHPHRKSSSSSSQTQPPPPEVSSASAFSPFVPPPLLHLPRLTSPLPPSQITTPYRTTSAPPQFQQPSAFTESTPPPLIAVKGSPLFSSTLLAQMRSLESRSRWVGRAWPLVSRRGVEGR